MGDRSWIAEHLEFLTSISAVPVFGAWWQRRKLLSGALSARQKYSQLKQRYRDYDALQVERDSLKRLYDICHAENQAMYESMERITGVAAMAKNYLDLGLIRKLPDSSSEPTPLPETSQNS